MRVLKRITVIYDRTINSFAVVAGVLIAAAMLIITMQVIMRYFVGRPQIWVLEATEYIMVWSTFLAAAWILRREGHVKVEIITAKFSPRAQAITGIVTSIIGAILCVLIVLYGGKVVGDFFQRNILIDSALAPPKAPFLAIIPVGSFLLCLQFLRRAGGYLQRWKAAGNKRVVY